MFRKFCLTSSLLLILIASALSGLLHAAPLDALLDPRISSLVLDRSGNRHYFWIVDDGTGSQIYYRMVSSTGLTVIDTLLIDQVHAKVRRPQVLVDPRFQIHLLWQERSFAPLPTDAKNLIRYVRFKLEPTSFLLRSLDHRMLNTKGDLSAKHPRMALNCRGEVAIVWEDPQIGILLTKLDPTGQGGVPTIIVPGPFQAPVQPIVTADPLGRLHIAWVNRSSEQAKTSRILYTVVSGQRLKPLIRPTALYSLTQPLKSVSISIVDGKHLEVGWSIERARGVYSSIGPDGSVSFELVSQALSPSGWTVLILKITETQLTRRENHRPRFVTDGVVLRDPVLKSPLAPIPLSLIQPPSIRKRSIIISQTHHSNEHLRFSLWALAPPKVSYPV